ncbi:MAG: tetraacyldisaccharide 4'-kinase [Candidatus Omnitrophica bacterium]|nr:tetraacyldisaccharide 4'-kinase [Candidatus Omnitrophota bacterium]
MWQALHDAWWGLATQHHPRTFSDVLAARALTVGSLAYRAAVTVRNAAYDRGWLRQVRLPCRVISVGNLTVGGTGKTACVELLAKKLLAMGKRVAVLSRGYAGSRGDYWLRWDAHHVTVNGQRRASCDGLADEPQLLARHLAGVPILVGPRRDRTGRLACRAFAADVVILDDGFQHRRLRRDCDIVLVHARTPFAGWGPLPRGPMREPLDSLARAHVVIVTKADEALETLGALRERLRSFSPNAAFVTAVHEPTGVLDVRTGQLQDPQQLNGLRVGLLSSIGDPQGFEATVGRLHATVLWHHAYPDHYRFQSADLAALAEQHLDAVPDAVVTTEKDWVRLQPLIVDHEPQRIPLWVLQVRMKVLNGEDALDHRLAGLWAR